MNFSHEFSYEPIKIRLIDLKSGSIKKTYVFVGSVPSDVESQLTKLERNVSLSSKVLQKFYGKNWRTVLGVSGITGGTDAKFTIDNEMLEGLDSLLGEATPVDHTEEKVEEKVEEPEKAEEIESIQQDKLEITEQDMTPAVDILEEVEKTEVIDKSTTSIEFVTDINVTPIDNILNLKKKIYLATGIPIYRQHLWFKYRDKSYPLNYVISINKHIENIDIERLISFYTKSSTSFENIENVPVELEYYNNKDLLYVSARDSFELLRNIYYKYSITEFHLVDLNDLVKPSDLYAKLSKDKYQLELLYYGFVVLYFPMITYSVFQDYLKNEKNIRDVYPDLMPDKTSSRNIIDLEDKIVAESYEASNNKALEKNLYSSITSTIISIDNYNQDVDIVISLRNLFDVIQLTDTITYCKANLLHNGQNVILRKAFFNEKEPKDIIPIDSLMIKVKTHPDTNENMRFVIFKNGNYIIRTEWREENHMDFAKIVAAASAKINPIIVMINKLGDKIKYHNIELVPITKKNTQFTETSLSFYYDSDVTEAKFGVLKNILYDFTKAQIITAKESVTLGLEYFFNKGMYKYDASRIEKTITLDNYYDFLSNAAVKQKWDTVFNRTRLFQIINISSKLKIAISGIRDVVEMDNFHIFLLGLISIFERSTAHMKITSREGFSKSTKLLKSLKTQDPLLYDFKKIYNSNVIYSKICQKPYQPVMLSEDEYQKLSKDKKSKATKYWNYTKQKPVWYSCPNPKYPYVKFIVKQHPKDYCIPCCKKIEMNENVNKKKQEIHNMCLSKYEYTGEKLNLTKGSHYIANYGKNIEPGRICRLPENTLEPLFFDTYSPEGGIDQECVTADGFYLFGVEQNLNMIFNIGLVHCIAHALSMTPVDFLHECSTRIRRSPDKFRVLLDGNAGLYFSSSKQMTDLIVDLDNDDGVESSLHDTVPWNMLFSSIAYYYFGVNTIIFDDQQKETIELLLPKGLKDFNEMFPETHKNLVVLRKKIKYYPIYLFNTEIFKKTGMIDTKLFLNESGLITIIKAIVRRSFESQEAERFKSHIDLASFKDFCKDSGISISKYYINYSNLCYAVEIKFKNEYLYFPIATSHYSVEKEAKLEFNIFDGVSPHFAIYSKLLELFDKWNVKKSTEAKLEGIYLWPRIEPQQWFYVRGNDRVIGFIHSNTNYFVSAMKQEEAKKIKDIPIQMLMYHPCKINAMIHTAKQKGKTAMTQPPELLTKLYNSLYEYNLYNIMLLHFISIFNSQRNTSIRKKITNIIAKANFGKKLDDIRDFINGIADVDDVQKLKNIIGRYITQHHDKKRLLEDIHKSYFNFDRISLENMKGKSYKEVLNELTKLSMSFIKIGKPKITDFPNMFTICGRQDSGLDYCSGKKLIIERQKLNDLLSIIASDIINPAKWKWIFNSAFVSKSVEFFRFIRRKNETITVEFIS